MLYIVDKPETLSISVPFPVQLINKKKKKTIIYNNLVRGRYREKKSKAYL